MRVVLRCDAGVEQGTGHVMRCLTLAEALRKRNHSVTMLTGPIDVEWLDRAVNFADIAVERCAAGHLNAEHILAHSPDWVVVDSYQFAGHEVNEMSARVRTLAIVDGDERGLDTQLFLDQTLGAEDSGRNEARYLCGAQFALVREDVLRQRRDQPWTFPEAIPRVLSVMGGSDPTHATSTVGAVLAAVDFPLRVTLIAPETDHAIIRATIPVDRAISVIAPTPRLPELLASTDILITAAGTTALDAYALGIPTILISVVDNQQPGLEQAVARGLALGIDARIGHRQIGDSLPTLLGRMVASEAERESLSLSCLATVDGRGKDRVVDRLESRYAPKDSSS